MNLFESYHIGKRYEIRCPVHGFIEFWEPEREIINHPAFQRLRRIKQLAFTDMVYPGAAHSRFEHSLGVMHVATKWFRNLMIEEKKRKSICGILRCDENELAKQLISIRIAALLHDIGQAPFSHASEEVFPQIEGKKKKFEHEDYSAGIIRNFYNDIIEQHYKKFGVAVDDVVSFIDNATTGTAPWKEIISSQADSDRMDYLLRDSHHAGVNYGVFDINRVLSCVDLGIDDENNPKLAFNYDGRHAVVALVLARDYMFRQVYYHKTRRIFDILLEKLLIDILPERHFTPPTNEKYLNDYIDWDDAKVLFLAKETSDKYETAKIFIEAINERRHPRMVYALDDFTDFPKSKEFEKIYEIKSILEKERINVIHDIKEKATYSTGKKEILLVERTGEVVSKIAEKTVLKNLIEPIYIPRLYVPFDQADKAREIIKGL